MSIELVTPLEDYIIASLKVGDVISLSGDILCGRDAVLPQVVSLVQEGQLDSLGIELQGQVVFHTAVSPAGVGPTSSNKMEIEGSIGPLSQAGIKIHLGKGQLKKETVNTLKEYNSVYAVIPPVTALLNEKIDSITTAAFHELGMEALHVIHVHAFPAIIAAAHGRSIYEPDL